MAVKKIMKVVLVASSVLIICIAAIGAVIYSHQKKAVEYALLEANKNFNGELVIKSSHISFFHNFPYTTIDLEEVAFYATKDTTQKPLYAIRDLYIGFSLLDLIKGVYTVQLLDVEDGHINIVHELDGSVNILNAKKITSDTLSNEPSLEWTLHELLLNDFHITNYYKRDSVHQELEIETFKGSIQSLDSLLHANITLKAIVTVMNGEDSTFFSNKHIAFSTQVDYYTKDSLIKISPTTLSLEDALFKASGIYNLANGGYVDLKIEGDKPDFSLFAAFAPNDIAAYLREYKNEGTIYFDGTVKGSMAHGALPHVHVDFGCEDAYFLNTEINKKIDGIAFKGFYTNGAGNSLQTSQLQLTNVTARPDKGVFTGDILITNFQDPSIAVNIHSDLELEFIGAFFKIEGLEQLRGNIFIDMRFNELVDIDVPENNLVKLKKGIDSDLRIENLYFKIPGYKNPIENMNIHAQMRKGFVELDTLSFRLGESDFFSKGSISDLPALFHHYSKPVILKASIRSKRLKVADFLEFNQTLADSVTEEITNLSTTVSFKTSVNDLLDHPGLPMGEFIIEHFYAKLKNYPHAIHDVSLDAFVNDSTINVKKFVAQVDKSDVNIKASVDNYRVWFDARHKGKSTINIDANSRDLFFNDLLSYQGVNYLPKEYRQEEIKQAHLDGKFVLEYDSILTFAEIDLEHASGQLKMHPIRIDQLKGKFHYEHEHLVITDFIGKMGKSDWNINMAFFAGKKASLKERDNYFSIISSSLNLDELMSYESSSTATHDEAFNIFTLPFADMSFTTDIKQVNYHKILLKDVKSKIRMQKNHYLYIDTLSMKAAQGETAMKGYFNGSNPEKIYFKSDIRIKHMHLDQLLLKFDNFGQDYVLNKNLKGVLTANIKSTVRLHPDLIPILEETEAVVQTQIDHGELIDYAPVLSLKSYFKDKNLNRIRFDTLNNTFHFKKNILYIDRMNINSSIGYIELNGQQSMDMNMNYHISVPLELIADVGFGMLFKGKGKEAIDPNQEDAIEYKDRGKSMFVHLQITGTPDNYKISKASKYKGV